ncbi:deoxyribodipyrimidine photo-lyase [bacterium]|nr:deoxyribodipyrimidine photo-lyase [bacterium]
MVDIRRIQKLTEYEYTGGDVLYWMSRDQRAQDNWALLYAQELANKGNGRLSVIFCLNPKFLGATLRQYDFMLKGLQETEAELREHNINLIMVFGEPQDEISEYIKVNEVSAIVTDFSPLKISRKWKNDLANSINIPFYEVDAHNIVPCFFVSNKMEYGAYTLRPKIHKYLDEFLTNFPKLKLNQRTTRHEKIDWDNLFKKLHIDTDVKPVEWVKPGSKHGLKQLKNFIENKIETYNDLRNIPTTDNSSNLSPYLHFGQISAQRVAFEVYENIRNNKKDSFIEELVVRKELSDNFCYYNQEYDNPKGYPSWAVESHKTHSKDKREYIYTLHKLETAKTHDDLWNAAQTEMVKTGKMHGYLRMYWAKKILEWTEDIETAHKYAIYLNDKYELDGRDPNGYTGIAWSLGGVHDRPWFTRPIFGKIRYMSYGGCKNKFNIEEYINKVNLY